MALAETLSTSPDVRAARVTLPLYETGSTLPKPRKPLFGLPLTRSEAKAVTLASKGKRNKDIAECLGWHEGTVKTVLSRAFAKEGISSRAELQARYFAGEIQIWILKYARCLPVEAIRELGELTDVRAWPERWLA